MSTAIHSGKVFKYVRGGVRILDVKTMQWVYVANGWYVGDLHKEIIGLRPTPGEAVTAEPTERPRGTF